MKEHPIKIVKLADFTVPELLERPLGNLEDLIKSIEDHDLRHPLLLGRYSNGLMILLSGYRRLNALQKVGWKKFPCIIVDDIFDAADVMEAERNDPNPVEGTEERLISERIRQGLLLEQFNAPANRQSRREGASRGGAARQAGIPKGKRPPIRESRAGKMRAATTRAVGLSSQATYHRSGYVYRQTINPESTEGERRYASQIMEEIDRTGLVSGGYERVRGNRGANALGTPQVVPEMPSDQRRMFTNGMNSLRGLTHGLEQITELHPKLSAVDIESYVAGLSDARRNLELTIKRLKRRLRELNKN